MGSTQRFNFLTLEDGTNLSSQGGRFGIGDRRAMDRILAALETHDHAGGDRLTNPVGVPLGQVVDAGGTLPGGLTLHYRVAFVDRFGLETAASDEITVLTPSRISPPQPPTLTAVAGGALDPGVHYYALTVEKDGQSTQLGSPAVITLQAGEGSVSLDLPTLPAGATGFGIWRQGPFDSYYTKIATTVVDPTVDDGSVPPDDCATDPAKLPPLTNRTNSVNQVEITAPDVARLADPESGIVAWRIYRTENSGQYPPNSLVAEVTEDDGSGGIVSTFNDTGAPLAPGQPKGTSQTLTPSVAIQGGGGGGSATVLLVASPDTSVWRVVADDLGQLTSRASGGADPGPTWLTSADETTWQVGITDGGVLSTTSGTPASVDTVYAAGTGPLLPTPDPTIDFLLTVDDLGQLVTTLI